GYTPMQLRELEDWVMERHLKQVPGVADVVSFGGFVKQYQVQVDPGQLQARRVTLRQVYEALGRSNANAGGNYVEHGEEQYVVRGLGTLSGAGDIEQVVVAARGGIPIRVRDLARVTVGAFPRRGVVTRDHEPEAVEGIVLMRRGENPSMVLDALHAKIEQLNHGILPPGVRIDTFYDRARLVRRTLTTVRGAWRSSTAIDRRARRCSRRRGTWRGRPSSPSASSSSPTSPSSRSSASRVASSRPWRTRCARRWSRRSRSRSRSSRC